MKINNIKYLARKEFVEYKGRIIGSAAIFLLFSIIGVILSLIRPARMDLELVKRWNETYARLYPQMPTDELVYLIISDFRIPVILLSCALVSPFLGILDSISSEKERRTIENLFALPLKDSEIIGGKFMSSFACSISLAWLIWLIHIMFLGFYSSWVVGFHLLDAGWLVLMILVIPACTLMMNLVGIILAVHVRKAYTGYNLGLLIFFPFALVIAFLAHGIYQLQTANLYIIIWILILIDVILFKIAYASFDRERIMLKYN